MLSAQPLHKRALLFMCVESSVYEPLVHELHALDFSEKWGDGCRLSGSCIGCVSMGLLGCLVPVCIALLTRCRSGMGNTSGSKALSVCSRGPALATAPHWKASPTARKLRQGQPREQQEHQFCAPKTRGPGTSVEPGVQADGSSAWEISQVRTEETAISKHGETAILGYTRVRA